MTNPDIDGHGTHVAGIIGAIRNNQQIGVAGVAGGDYDDNNNFGVNLYAMKCFGPSSYIDAIYNAMYEGVAGNNNNPPQLDIFSNSWSILPSSQFYTGYSIAELKKVVRFAFDNEIVIINSRGNSGYDEDSYPSTYYKNYQTGDDWVISVGASGTDGEYKDNTNGDVYSANWGDHLDVIAPGTSELVYTTDNISNTSYGTFSGTSASCPHVSGVAALLLDYSSTPLAPEDVEHLIEYGAADKFTSGYDIKTGWGLLQAGSAINQIFFPHYRVVHFEVQPTSAIALNYNLPVDNLLDDYDIYSAGPIWLNTYKYTATIQHNLGTNAQIVNVSGKPGYWVRNSGSNLWGAVITNLGGDKELLPETNVQFETTPTVQSATISGYYYGVRFVPNEPVIIPYGADTNASIAYSLLIYDPDYTNLHEIPDNYLGVNIFPNPANYTVSVAYSLPLTSYVTIILSDMLGCSFYVNQLGIKQPGEYQYQMNTNELSSGMYFITIKTDEKIVTKKFLKY
ncbi:MAG: S8 family peptidase [Bacteroidetes bacterium]|nr:S8 family peptidase [Bacteroidota bacterium]MBU1718725.1 S8 family peptidase [Bacteroidota bacterium]